MAEKEPAVVLTHEQEEDAINDKPTAEKESTDPATTQVGGGSEEPDDGVSKVLVTGATGYVAQHIIKQLLEKGEFRVRGTVRNKSREDKIKPLLNIVPDAKYPLNIVEADLLNAESWINAVKGCSYVYHVASPLVMKIPKNEDELIRPAVEGTVNVLQACANSGTVKKVVVTSSLASVSSGLVGTPGKPPDYVYTEEDWSEESILEPYQKSKLKAEQAAWDFMKKLDENKRFELAIVHPGLVQGPMLTPLGGAVSSELARLLLTNGMPLIPDNTFPVVDVRDVASAHIAAMEKPEATGKRFVLSSHSGVHMRDFAQIIADEFTPQGYKVPIRNMPNALLWTMKFFSATAKQLYLNRGKSLKYDNQRMVKELGIEPIPLKDTIVDTCYSLIELGIVNKTPGYLGHPSTRQKQKPDDGDDAAKGEQ